MPSGAYLIVEPTEAMHVIDVNSGYKMSNNIDHASNALTVNLEAIDEIARQLRLRDLGGIITIDFIDVRDPEHKKMMHRRMKEAMESDRARHTILPLNKFGIMQITRERVRPAVKVSTAELCPSCKGTGKVKPTILIIDEIANNLSYLLNELDYSQLTLRVHPFVDAYLKRDLISIQWKWFWQHKKWVTIISDNRYVITEYHFFDHKNEEIRL
jgi:ribonuclease G